MLRGVLEVQTLESDSFPVPSHLNRPNDGPAAKKIDSLCALPPRALHGEGQGPWPLSFSEVCGNGSEQIVD